MINRIDFIKRLCKFQVITSRSLERKISDTMRYIEAGLKISKSPALACSWGKDSFLMLYFVLKLCPDIPVIFSNTGIEFPETYRFRDRILKEMDINYIEVKGDMSFWEIVDKYGYPGQSRYSNIGRNEKGVPACCSILKEKPAEKWYKENGIDLVFVGLNFDEGRLRRTKIIESGPLYYVKNNKLFKCLPLAYWKEDEVFSYTMENGLPMNEGYKISPRIGCQPCTGHIGWKKQMAKTNYRIYKKVMRDLGNPVLDDFF